MITYLDFAATAPVLPEVLEEMIEIYRSNYGNAGSRTHAYGWNANQVVEKARRQIANVLTVPKQDVIFTSGASEANNLAILGLASWGKKNGKTHILSTQIEHKAVLEPLEHMRSEGFEVELVPVGEDGRVTAEDVLSRVRDDTLVVSVMHANNETGTIQPVQEIGEALHSTTTYFHIDAAQTFGKLVEELRDTRCDMITASGHKVYGPQGIGALVMRPRHNLRPPLSPLMFGGGQERGIRPGTQPVALIAGFGLASELVSSAHGKWHEHCLELRVSILRQISAVNYCLNGSAEHCLPNLLNISFPGVDSEALMLSVKDCVAISNGSACTSTSYKPSHVLLAMGLPTDRVEGSVRLSWGPHLTSIDLTPLVLAVKRFQ